MFSEAAFDDFTALWLLVHATRLEGGPPSECWLERWANDARQQGVRALETLGNGFQDAIETLGQGFLAHTANTNLKQRLRDGSLDRQGYYRQLLRVVYRLVFLLVAEDRELIHPPGTPDEARERYARYYSLSRIRDLARRRRGTKHSDLWQQITIVSHALGANTGLPALGLPALGSALWASDATADLDAARIPNTYLLAAIRSLSYTQQDQALHRIDYRNLGSEELGSIYESLLELKPDLDTATATFSLRRTSGNERKTTGSYYTPTSLISALLDVSLDRLLDEAEGAPDPEQAILALKIIDPACGSGHFLVAAAQRIARRLAAVRTGEANPTPEAARHALRDVIGRCIFGIDLNPMAVELCKVSLWLEAVEPGKPLSFLDHHIVCGNGLLGATPRLLDAGVPDEAFTAIEGDDKPTVVARRKTNRNQRARRSQGTLGFTWDTNALTAPVAAAIAAIEALPSDTPEQVAEQAARYVELQASAEAEKARLAADAWCAAFVITKTKGRPVVTDETVRTLSENPAGVAPEILEKISTLAARYRFLHWHLAFPQVFTIDLAGGGETGCTGGFDLILGNPPWETMSPDRREFLGEYVDGIRAMSPEEQDAAIEGALADPVVANDYDAYRRDLFAQVHFLKNSGRYTLYAKGNLGKGDFNIYRMFVETALRNTRIDGYAAQITPAGLYGGANATAIRKHLLDACRLSFLFGCENTRKSFFPSVHPQTWFSVYAARRGGSTEIVELCFGITNPSELPPPPARVISVPAQLIREQAPDTYAIPDLRNPFEMTVAAKMVDAHPAFGDISAGPPIRHYQREVDMGNDTGLFTTDPAGLPLYEGRMIDHFDHRAKMYVSGHGNSAKWFEPVFDDPAKAIAPQWRVLRRDIPTKLADRCDRYRIGFGDVANPRNERSFVATIIPPDVICGHTVPTIVFGSDQEWAYLLWLAVANSFAMDWLTRTRLSSAHLEWYILDRFPFPRYPIAHPLVDRLAPAVLRLICTSPEMTEYWNAMAPYGWCQLAPLGATPDDALIDAKARAETRAEVDAIVAKHVYGLSLDELAYALDQFPVLEKRDRKAYGTYATKDRILERYADV